MEVYWGGYKVVSIKGTVTTMNGKTIVFNDKEATVQVDDPKSQNAPVHSAGSAMQYIIRKGVDHVMGVNSPAGLEVTLENKVVYPLPNKGSVIQFLIWSRYGQDGEMEGLIDTMMRIYSGNLVSCLLPETRYPSLAQKVQQGDALLLIPEFLTVKTSLSQFEIGGLWEIIDTDVRGETFGMTGRVLGFNGEHGEVVYFAMCITDEYKTYFRLDTKVGLPENCRLVRARDGWMYPK